MPDDPSKTAADAGAIVERYRRIAEAATNEGEAWLPERAASGQARD